jgi:hypothetical protein
MKERRFHTTLAAVTLCVLLFSAWGLWASGITVALPGLLLRLALLALLLVGVAFYRWRQEEKLLNLLLMCFWAVLLSNLHMIPMFLAGRQSGELSDALLARMDAALGVEVPAVLNAVARVPFLKPVLDVAYGTLIFLMALAVIVPPLSGRMEQAKEYALGCLAAAMISMPVFAVFRAVGPWSVYALTPTPEQARYTEVLVALRSGRPFTLDLSYASGLITFPSFHAILAVLAALALRHTRYLRWPAAVVAALVVLSTITTGWHYLVDVWAGLLVALLSFAAARVYLRLEGRPGHLPRLLPIENTCWELAKAPARPPTALSWDSPCGQDERPDRRCAGGARHGGEA